MYDFIRSALAELLPDPAVSFVFPSEVAAASWARRSLEIGGVRALFTDRFLGWDTFKDRLFSRRGRGRTADERMRLLWAASALEANARSPFLEVLLRPEHRGEYAGYLPFAAGILPGLRRISERAGRLPGDGKLRDFSALYARYGAFLAEHGLFEPTWEPLPAPESDRSYLLVCPELARDYEEYRAALASSPSIRVLELPEPVSCPGVLEFPNLYEELRWIFLSVARDLDSGLRPEDLAVTVPDLDETAPWIEKAAAQAGVPAEIRSGLPLARQPVGRFLTALGACAERGFDLESMTALLLDRFLPWKRPDLPRALVRFGLRRHSYAPYAAEGRTRDPWLESFRVCGVPEPGLDSFYRRLKTGAERVTGARDFRSLADSFVAFRREFLDESRLSEADHRSFQRAMDELKAFVREETELGLPAPAGSAFSLFRNFLSEIRYVSQSALPAVPVYAYRVSALQAVLRHYVAGASQEGLKVSFGDAPGLRDDEKEALGLPDRDAAPAYARAYAASGATVFSYAVEGFRGWNLPFPWFSREGGIRQPTGEVTAADPWSREARAYRGDAFPDAFLAEQKAAFLSASVSLRAPASDYERDRADPEAARIILARATREDGKLRLSATQSAELLSCPFSWLLARGLALEEEKSGVGFFDALLAGEMAHETLRVLYERISESGPFDGKRLEEYRSWVRPAVDRILPGFEARHGPFLRPMFEAYIPKLEDRVGRLLVEEARSFQGWRVECLEGGLEKEYPELEAVLVGRLDRLAGRDGEFAIIDYKKRSLPKKADVFPDEEGHLAAPQMASYVLLCETGGRGVSLARYWSLEDARALDVLGPGARTREEYVPALEAFEAALGKTAQRLRAGDFRPPKPEDRDCGSCGWRAVCRTGYATERG